ncbi:MAG: DUF5329 family protein [Candidatus Omnitrophica bacterium]|nr:DUF5329 family protein [Candidatus Omnitrophota bacterium]
MKKTRPIFFSLFFLIGLASCQSQSKILKENPGIFLDPHTPVQRMTSFKRILRLQPGTHQYEQGRIDYLMDRLSHSSYDFIRNGISYNGVRAAKHLKMKMLRHYEKGESAEYFVDHIANGSRQSGKKYLVRIDDKALYSTQTLLHNELQLLDAELKKYVEKLSWENQEPWSRPYGDLTRRQERVENSPVSLTAQNSKNLKGIPDSADHKAN